LSDSHDASIYEHSMGFIPGQTIPTRANVNARAVCHSIEMSLAAEGHFY
jgi:hypothetical protein